ncbi:MAG: DUF1302 family protein [bacterium]
MMKQRTCAVVAFWTALFFVGLTDKVRAFYVDENQTLEISAKVQTRATIRLQDSDTEQSGKGFSYPQAEAGDLVQHRNLGIVEINHDVRSLTRDLDLLYPFRILKADVKYHVVGRFLYEGIYDYGPEVFQDVRAMDRENLDRFKQSYDLWECYADISRGPFFLRLGRQNLAWGETDIFRLLDGINPLDNTFGGPFEDLDDRRVPLWMLRSSLNLGLVGPIDSLTLEGFLVPGKIDAHVAPWAPRGSAYAAPLPAIFAPSVRVITPDREWSESRWGFRMQGIVAHNLTLSVAHYQTFLDMPTLRSHVVGTPPILTDLDSLQLWAEFPEVRITGASANYWESRTDTVFRGEVAWFWNEPVFIPQVNTSTLFGPQLELPDPVLDVVADLLGVDIRDLGLRGLPLNPQSGSIPRKDILRYMLGFDKQIWVRPLNKVNTFFISGQYFGQWVPDFDERMATPALVYPSLRKYVPVSEFEHVFTFIGNSMYLKGNLQPQVACAYDLKGAILLQPSINFIHEPFRFMLQYSVILGSFANFGLFRDRDQVSFIFTYLLN